MLERRSLRRRRPARSRSARDAARRDAAPPGLRRRSTSSCRRRTARLGEGLRVSRPTRHAEALATVPRLRLVLVGDGDLRARARGARARARSRGLGRADGSGRPQRDPALSWPRRTSSRCRRFASAATSTACRTSHSKPWPRASRSSRPAWAGCPSSCATARTACSSPSRSRRLADAIVVLARRPRGPRANDSAATGRVATIESRGARARRRRERSRRAIDRSVAVDCRR